MIEPQGEQLRPSRNDEIYERRTRLDQQAGEHEPAEAEHVGQTPAATSSPITSVGAPIRWA